MGTPFDPRPAVAHTWGMATPVPPPPETFEKPPQHDFGPTDAADLLSPTGTLSHGGRAYRRELVARMLAGRVEWTPHDIRKAISTANQVLLALAGTPPAQVADRPATR